MNDSSVRKRGGENVAPVRKRRRVGGRKEQQRKRRRTEGATREQKCKEVSSDGGWPFFPLGGGRASRRVADGRRGEEELLFTFRSAATRKALVFVVTVAAFVVSRFQLRND